MVCPTPLASPRSPRLASPRVSVQHHEEAVLHTANRGTGEAAGQICYHSLHENKILRFFKGHTDFVTSISMNPTAGALRSSMRRRAIATALDCIAAAVLTSRLLCVASPPRCRHVFVRVSQRHLPHLGLACTKSSGACPRWPLCEWWVCATPRASLAPTALHAPPPTCRLAARRALTGCP